MGGIAPTSPIVPSNYAGQSSSTAYPTNIDGNAIAGLRIWGNAAPRTWPTPNMTLSIDPTHLFNGGTGPTELGAWTTGTSSSSTNTLTAVTNTTGVAVGQSVFAFAYISGVFTQLTPTNAIVTAIAGTTVTFSGGNASASQSGATVVFGQPVGTVVSGNAHGTLILDSLQSTAGIFAGMAVSGTGVSGGTTVTSVDSPTQVHVSANVTAGTGISFTFSVPTQTGNPRIDRVVVSQSTGAVQWVMGTPAASPLPPNVPAGTMPVCQLAIGTSTTAITSTSVVADERHFTAAPQINWATAGGAADALTATYAPANTALTDGLLVGLRAAAANATTTPTFAPDGLAAHTITKQGGVALVPGDIPGNLAELLLRYNLANTRWELLNPAIPGTVGTFTPVVKFSGASTGITYTTQTGRYRRIGNRVEFSAHVLLSNKGSATGNATMDGLPFTAANSGDHVPAILVASLAFTGLTGALTAVVVDASTAVHLWQTTTTSVEIGRAHV